MPESCRGSPASKTSWVASCLFSSESHITSLLPNLSPKSLGFAQCSRQHSDLIHRSFCQSVPLACSSGPVGNGYRQTTGIILSLIRKASGRLRADFTIQRARGFQSRFLRLKEIAFKANCRHNLQSSNYHCSTSRYNHNDKEYLLKMAVMEFPC